MADDLSNLIRRAVDANVRYYEALGRVVSEYVRDLGDAVNGFKPRLDLPTIQLPTMTTNAPAAKDVAARPEVSEPAPRPAVVLEASPGTTAHGAVLVENHLAHPVSAVIHAEVDAATELTVEPDRVDLAPGETVVVRVSTRIAEDASDAEVRGQLLVPDLVGTAVPLVVRVRR